jgi:hypothetical protein
MLMMIDATKSESYPHFDQLSPLLNITKTFEDVFDLVIKCFSDL